MSQRAKTTKTFHFLTPIQSWYFVLHPDSSLVISTSRSKDTTDEDVIKSKLFVKGRSVYVDSDTSAFDRLRRINFELFKNNVQFIVSGKSIRENEVFPLFRLANFYTDSVEAKKAVLNTFISYDLYHGYRITLKKDNTYVLMVWDHMTEPNYETGTWAAKDNFFIFIPKEKGFSFFDWFTAGRKMFLLQDFLIGKKVSHTKKGTTMDYVYLMKMPIK